VNVCVGGGGWGGGGGGGGGGGWRFTYAVDVNLDSSALKDAGVDCSTVHHMGRKRVPVSYGSNRKRVAECSC